jgi:hypothetical protein
LGRRVAIDRIGRVIVEWGRWLDDGEKIMVAIGSCRNALAIGRRLVPECWDVVVRFLSGRIANNG